MYKQTYANYHRAYLKTEAGRLSHNRSVVKWKRKLAAQYNTSQPKAVALHKEALRKASNA